ncbi:phosphate regulon sensor histidine kinase PhoR [Rhodoferax sediminis]|uniref:Phosphate regulon sensor protein PhoR n=1 Tax=Rhodoferax sediminis TaxID=2509614 RepID=A0A515DAN4_9BURK|nr:phosphate regulon sensor histidine kinase PhoR [Rhodoferax sediminis]QDL37472.1 phosphate regulon sensor histidine kinase PhoR [Rhodoferax sediminis]
MLFRFFSFLMLQFASALAGWWLGGRWGALAGLALAGLLWFTLDLLRGARVLRWLKQGEASGAPALRGLWGEVSDRTRRLLRQREQQTQDSQARLQEFLAAIQASPNGVVLLDKTGCIEWCNQIAAEQFGFDAQRDVLQQIGNLVRDPAFAAYYTGGDYAHEITIAGPGSTPSRPIRVSIHLHPYGEGRKLLLSRDVTALEQAEAMRRDFVANVSHEIRTPLTVLAGFVETLRTLPLNESERGRYLALMAQQSERMQTLVNDLLTLSRLEGRPPPGAAEWTPVHSLLERCLQEARTLSALVTRGETAGHELRFDPAPSPRSMGEIAGAPNELHSALSNLLNNAVRYTPAGGVIEVQWRVLPDGRAEFSVKDSGPGIAPEHIPRLTERFYRIDRSRSRETGGTGLGLAIVKHVAQRHGAELRIDSTPGLGSTFSIIFPASRIKGPGGEAPAPAPAAPPVAARPATESLQK